MNGENAVRPPMIVFLVFSLSFWPFFPMRGLGVSQCWGLLQLFILPLLSFPVKIDHVCIRLIH